VFDLLLGHAHGAVAQSHQQVLFLGIRLDSGSSRMTPTGPRRPITLDCQPTNEHVRPKAPTRDQLHLALMLDLRGAELEGQRVGVVAHSVCPHLPHRPSTIWPSQLSTAKVASSPGGFTAGIGG